MWFFTRGNCCLKITWKDVLKRTGVFLYAGDLSLHAISGSFIGLSLFKNDRNHLRHDITCRMPLPGSCVDIYQAEDVFEHIQYEKLKFVVDEIYRVLKPGGLFRLSIPDYRCDFLIDRSVKDGNGKIVFDPGGGGRFVEGRVIEGGHVWFPTIEQVRLLLDQSAFARCGKIIYLHYYTEYGISVINQIDYSICYVDRTPDHDERVKNPYRPLSIVVDLYKR